MLKPQTRLLFTEKGKPIEGLAVKTEASGESLLTDQSGQVEIELVEGRQRIQILKDGEWTPQMIDASRESSLIIVDLGKQKTGPLPAFQSDVSFLDIGRLNLGDRYVYEQVIGRGGMSVVIKARDRLLNREVAVKLLSQELQAVAEAQEIFLAEARNLATLSHPNLVSVHDICRVEDQVFIVIELVEGENLEKLINSVKGFNEIVTLQTTIQLARVIGYLHDQGVIHRDLKPANAMIRNDGTLKLIDFGLARHFEELYMKGTRVRGTPAYMAPEQILGGVLTPACDVYQVGICLFEMLTGVLPFTKGELGYAHVNTPPPLVSEIKPEVGEDLVELVDKCLRKNPKDRPKDGQELLRELQAIYQTRGIEGGNILDGLQHDIQQQKDSRTTNHSQVRMKALTSSQVRITDFSARDLSDVLSDPSIQSQIIIQQGGNRWAPAIVGSVLAAVIAIAGFYLIVDNNQAPQQTQREDSGLATTVQPQADPLEKSLPTVQNEGQPSSAETNQAATAPAAAVLPPAEPSAKPQPVVVKRAEPARAKPAQKPPVKATQPESEEPQVAAIAEVEEPKEPKEPRKTADTKEKKKAGSAFAPSTSSSGFLGDEKPAEKSGFLRDTETKKPGGFL